MRPRLPKSSPGRRTPARPPAQAKAAATPPPPAAASRARIPEDWEPSRPLPDAAHERIVQALYAQGASPNKQDAYKAGYPQATYEAAHVGMRRLSHNVPFQQRLAWLQSQVAARNILTRDKVMDILAQAILDRVPGFRGVLKIDEAGNKMIEITEANAHIVKRAKTSQQTTGRGDDRETTTFVDCEVSDFLPYLQEFNALAAYYPPKKTEVSGNLDLRNLYERIADRNRGLTTEKIPDEPDDLALVRP